MKKQTKRHIRRSFFLFGAVLVFTLLDWLVHQASPILEVPSWYFRNKIIFATLYACIIGFFVEKSSLKVQAAMITLITVTLLEIRYISYGYPFEFHAIIFPTHLILLYGATYVALYLEKNKK